MHRLMCWCRPNCCIAIRRRRPKTGRTLEKLLRLGIKVDLTNIDLSNLNLGGLYLNHTNLSHAVLKGCNLFWASFTHANLTGTDLSGVNLSHADLSAAVFEYVELRSNPVLTETNWHEVRAKSITVDSGTRLQLPLQIARRCVEPDAPGHFDR